MRTVRSYVCSAFAIIDDMQRRFSLGSSHLSRVSRLIYVKRTNMECSERAVLALVTSPAARDVGDDAAVHETALASVHAHHRCV